MAANSTTHNFVSINASSSFSLFRIPYYINRSTWPKTHPGRSQGWQAVDGPELELHLAPRPANSSSENTVHKQDEPHLSAENKLSHNGNENSEKKQSTIDWMSRIWPPLLERHQMSIFFYQSLSMNNTVALTPIKLVVDLVFNVMETQTFQLCKKDSLVFVLNTQNTSDSCHPLIDSRKLC